MESHQRSVFPKALQGMQNQLVSHCNRGMLSKSSNGYCCSWVRKIYFHSFYCCWVWGSSCRQRTCSQENHRIGYDAKRNKYAPEHDQKIIFFHWKCRCTWSFNCSQKAIFYIWHFFNFSLDDPGKTICSIYNKRVHTHKPGAYVGTSVLRFHLQVLQPMYSSDCSQNKI